METFQLVSEAFTRAPFLLLVPLALGIFIFWHPWAERKFYHVPDELVERDRAELE